MGSPLGRWRLRGCVKVLMASKAWVLSIAQELISERRERVLDKFVRTFGKMKHIDLRQSGGSWQLT